MKKLLLVAALFSSAVFANAQDKPEQGTISTEVGLNIFNGKDNITLPDANFKLRYFLSDQDALRLSLGFSGKSNTTYPNLSTSEGLTGDALTKYNLEKDNKFGNYQQFL